uniref:hypothetical protein n=1 Tax=Bernardetia sp. TaxID=1937974 RepID=UPI0025C36209
ERFDLKNVRKKKFWIAHEKTESNIRNESRRFNKTKTKRKEQLRLNSFNTAKEIYRSFINSYNAGDCEFIVVDSDGNVYFETSKWLLKHHYTAVCDSDITAARHLERIHNTAKEGCKVFLPNWLVPPKKVRFDANIRLKINTEMLAFAPRRSRFKS